MSHSANVARALLAAQAVLLRPTDPFTFASGIKSPIYCDNRLLIGNVAVRQIVSDAFASIVGDAQVVAGTATAGIPWAAWVAERAQRPMAYVRSGAKAHGRGRQVEGASIAGQSVLLLEDTVSTGESAVTAIEALYNEGAARVTCACIFTYGWQATFDRFDAAKAPLTTLTWLTPVLDVAIAEGYLKADERATVEAWSASPTTWGV
ncbi:MAG: orotate phosphoribosyltransferase [Roseiflexaceae bacterium]